MYVTSLDIIFSQYELPDSKVQQQNVSLMIMAVINKNRMKHILIYNGLGLNVSSIHSFPNIGVDTFLTETKSLSICGFGNMDIHSLGTIMLLVKVRLMTLPMLFHVMPNVWVWICVTGEIPSIL